MQLKKRVLAELDRFRMSPLTDKLICDIGCGSGHWLHHYLLWGAQPRNIYGIDLYAADINSAQESISNAHLVQGNAEHLPWEDSKFDIVSQFKVFCTILDDDVKRQIAKEMLRIVKPNGIILWVDQRYAKPSNKASRGVGKNEIRQLFPECSVHYKLAVLVPQLARLIVPFSWILAEVTEKFPFMASHYIAIIQKKG